MGRPLIVLDADGVFLDERPYWNAALASALLASGLDAGAPERWEALASEAFERRGLQRVAKRRGCNSNHDLAAVLARTLEQPAVRDSAAGALEGARDAELAELIVLAADERWAGSPSGPNRDPLAGFDIDRRGDLYARVAGLFQRVLAHEEPGLTWRFRAERLRESREATLGFLAGAAASGFELRVCTGRPRAEIDGPLERFGLSCLLPAAAVTSADEVARAERLTGEASLGKPHSFPVLCALAGFDAALDTLQGDRGAALPPATYVGDAPADLLACERAARHGVDVRYVHMRSPAVDEETVRGIAARPLTIGVIDRLEEIVPIASGAAAR